MKKYNIVLTILLLLGLYGCCTFNLPYSGTSNTLLEVKLQGSDDDKILVIPIDGVISNEQKSSGFFSPKQDSMIAKTVAMLKKASKDSNIKGVLLKIDSPGGTVTGSDLLYKEILNFKKQTNLPVVSLFAKVTASGGYYVAMASDYIVAQPTNITGSIGVVMQSINAKEGLEKIGVKDQSILSGRNKAIGSSLREMTEEQKQILQSVVDDLYGRFFQVVVRGRKNLTPKQIRPLADGRIFTSNQAKKHGLVDQIGYLEDAVKSLMKRPNYKKSSGNNDPKVVTYTNIKREEINIYQVHNEGSQPNTLVEYLNNRFDRKFMYLWTP